MAHVNSRKIQVEVGGSWYCRRQNLPPLVEILFGQKLEGEGCKSPPPPFPPPGCDSLFINNTISEWNSKFEITVWIPALSCLCRPECRSWCLSINRARESRSLSLIWHCQAKFLAAHYWHFCVFLSQNCCLGFQESLQTTGSTRQAAKDLVRSQGFMTRVHIFTGPAEHVRDFPLILFPDQPYPNWPKSFRAFTQRTNFTEFGPWPRTPTQNLLEIWFNKNFGLNPNPNLNPNLEPLWGRVGFGQIT